ncbi:unnamed protein product, partial [Nesidiocoris tenuis]
MLASHGTCDVLFQQCVQTAGLSILCPINVASVALLGRFNSLRLYQVELPDSGSPPSEFLQIHG